MKIPNTMTMRELRDFTIKNGLYYHRIYNTKNMVAIYEDRYYYERIGTVVVPDYRPIKNYKSMGHGANHNAQILKVLKEVVSCLEFRERSFPDGHSEYEICDDDCHRITGQTLSQEEYRMIKDWLEENK